jgi:hypothetical protein
LEKKKKERQKRQCIIWTYMHLSIDDNNTKSIYM